MGNSIEQTAEERRSALRKIWENYFQGDPLAFVTTFLSAEIATDFLKEHWQIKFFDEHLLAKYLLIFCISVLVARFFEVLKRSISRSRRLTEALMTLLTPQEIAQNIVDIASLPYPTEIANHIARLNNRGVTFIDSVKTIARGWKDKIGRQNNWRIILDAIIAAAKNSVQANLFSMPLKYYLEILLYTIEVGIERADKNGSAFVIHSYTNALPKDWFRDKNPVVGENMQDYSDKLRVLIDRMKEKKYEYRRYIWCADHLAEAGFPDKAQATSGWNGCTLLQKNQYLDRLHSSPELGFLADLEPEVKLEKNYTELIYFGFRKTRERAVTWQWCYCCAYTNNNLNVSASFLDLSSEQGRLIIDVENVREVRLAPSMTIPHRLQIEYSALPSLFERIAKVERLRNLVPLAVKWDLAATIWHSEREKTSLKEFFRSQLPLGASILDCACGTGFHAFMLAEEGYEVTASDNDSGNLDILRSRMKARSVSLKVVKANWQTSADTIHQKFDCVACLGSSITYLESWDEDVRDIKPDLAKVENVVENFKRLLKPGGKFIIGISRHYDRGVRGSRISFLPKEIDDVQYFMDWDLKYDWTNRKKYWECTIKNSDGDDFSFELVSHLFDRDDLLALCRSKFSSVKHCDIDSAYYDTFLVCSL